MGTLSVVNLGAIGSLGLNTQSSEIDLDPKFATEALNAVVDQSGKLSARKSVTLYSASNTDLSTAALKRIYRHNNMDGTATLVSAGNGKIFTASTTTLTSRLSASGATKNNWQFASLNGKLFAAQSGENFTSFTEGGSWTSATISTPAKPSTIHAAYGRLWAGNITSNNYTLYWSVLNDGTDFSNAGSGSLDMREIFVNGKDYIVSVSSHNSRVIVFCRYSVYILGLAQDLDPGNSTTPIYLVDAIANIGCVARDSVVSTGDDIFFLADDGIRSLQRSMSVSDRLPLTDVTVLNHNKAITDIVRGQTQADIAAAYWPDESWYMLFLPDSKEVWVFDVSNTVPTPDGSVPRTTTWGMSNRPVYHAAYYTDDVMYFAGVAGIFDYAEYDITDSYRFSVSTGWLSCNDPNTLKHFKRALLSVSGGGGQTGFIKWSVDFDEVRQKSVSFTLTSSQDTAQFGISEYEDGEFSLGQAINSIYTQIGNSAKFIKFTIDLPVYGYQISINDFSVNFNRGKVR